MDKDKKDENISRTKRALKTVINIYLSDFDKSMFFLNYIVLYKIRPFVSVSPRRSLNARQCTSMFVYLRSLCLKNVAERMRTFVPKHPRTVVTVNHI
jgi:hypothetical protein